VDLRVQHHCTSPDEAASHLPCLQLQDEISGKPQTDIIPFFAHSAWTPFGSVGLLTLTQAG
jgi:hypothetical protein